MDSFIDFLVRSLNKLRLLGCENALVRKTNIFNENKLLTTCPFIELLISNYNAKDITFGDFQLFDKIVKVNNYYVFAISSYSYLGCRRDDTEIIEFDYESYNILYEVASDDQAFLKTLLILEELYTFRCQDKLDLFDKKANKKYIDKCAEIAGGDRYRKFYQCVIGM